MAPDNVPVSPIAKSWIYNDQVPFDIGGCKPSKIVIAGELPVVNVTGDGALNGIELVTKVLFLNVPAVKPSQVVES